MALRIGINGFGRIGRMVFRAVYKEAEFSDIEIVGINDLLDPDYLAYMLKYDSVHGNFNGEVAVAGGNLVVNGRTIRLSVSALQAALGIGVLLGGLLLSVWGGFRKRVYTSLGGAGARGSGTRDRRSSQVKDKTRSQTKPLVL